MTQVSANLPLEAEQQLGIDPDEMQNLRGQLLAIGPDYQGASELIQAFVHGLGYGISPEAARRAAMDFGMEGCSLASITRALDRAVHVA